MIIHQLDGGLSPSTSASVKVAKGSMAGHSFHAPSANWQGSSGHGGWVLQSLGLGQGLLWLLQCIIPASEMHVLNWEELIPAQGMRGGVQSNHWRYSGHDSSS